MQLFFVVFSFFLCYNKKNKGEYDEKKNFFYTFCIALVSIIL